MPDIISILRSDFQQSQREKYQQRLLNASVPVSISNVVAHKIWYGHVSPSAPGRLASPVCSHGKRYLSWDVTLTCTDGVNTWSMHSYGTFGRKSGAVVVAQTDITDSNLNYDAGQFHGLSRDLACGHITAITSPTEASMHMTFDTSRTPPLLGTTNPVCTGSMDIVLSDVNDYTQLQVDCRDIYLSDGILSVPDNAWRLQEWQVATNSQAQSGWLSGAYASFARGPCPSFSGDTPTTADTRFNWPVVNCNINGHGVGVIPSNGTGSYPAGAVGGSAITWPTMGDYQLLVETLDTSGFLQGNGFAQLFSGGDTGVWTMIGALYRHMSTDHHCIKTRVTGQHFDSGSGLVVSPPLDNVDLCASHDNNLSPRKTFYIDAPFITINADNNEVDVYADPNFSKRASSETDGSCDCVGKPAPPFATSATPGGAVMVVAWSVNAGDHIINVDIYRSETPGAEGLLQSAWGSGSPYLDGLVTAGHTYYYRIKARNAWGLSDFSDEFSATL